MSFDLLWDTTCFPCSSYLSQLESIFLSIFAPIDLSSCDQLLAWIAYWWKRLFPFSVCALRRFSSRFCDYRVTGGVFVPGNRCSSHCASRSCRGCRRCNGTICLMSASTFFVTLIALALGTAFCDIDLDSEETLSGSDQSTGIEALPVFFRVQKLSQIPGE